MQIPWVALSAAIVVVLSYVAGSIPWGFLIGKFNGLDIRYHGSGNIGATNVRRVLGRDWGILCFVLDFLKGLLPVLLIGIHCGGAMAVGAEYGGLLAAAATVCGHIWPFWLKFKGGKGVATTIGAVLAVAPLSVLIALISWVVLFYTFRYVSVASLGAAAMLPVGCIIVALVRGGAVLSPTLGLLVLLAGVIVFRHRSNLQRLINGTEYRFDRKVVK